MTGDKRIETVADAKLPRAPKLALKMMSQDVTARRAVRIIASVTVAFAVVGGVLMRIFDAQDFSSIGEGLWFSLQTVTTVGYGDVVPHNTEGRIVAALVMLAGIGFIAVITAAVTAALVESARRGPRQAADARMERHLEEINARLAAMEAAISPKE
jgi:voltage-gated potassium channel